MPAFAAWIGRFASAVAAILAIVWLFEASPDDSGRAIQAVQAQCRAQALAGINATSPDWLYNAAHARAARCADISTGWDQGLVNRALLAGGAAVVLVLLTALIPKPAPAYTPPPPRPAPLSFTELSRRVEIEMADHKRMTGRDLPAAEARRRVEWRHAEGLHREPPP